MGVGVILVHEILNVIRNIKTGIISLIQEGLNKDENTIPLSMKDKVWTILKILIKDKNLTEEKELKWLSQNGPLWDFAINSVRGIAFNSIIQYGMFLTSRQNSNNGYQYKT